MTIRRPLRVPIAIIVLFDTVTIVDIVRGSRDTFLPVDTSIIQASLLTSSGPRVTARVVGWVVDCG